MVNSFQPLTIFTKSYILDVLLDSECAVCADIDLNAPFVSDTEHLLGDLPGHRTQFSVHKTFRESPLFSGFHDHESLAHVLRRNSFH